MVARVVHHVDAHGVDPELGELGDVALAERRVGEEIIIAGGAAGLVIDAAEVEASAAGPEGWKGDC